MLRLNQIAEKRLYKILARCTIVLLAGLLYALFVRVTEWKIPCLFYEITGLNCPGCGVTRMAMALLRFDITAAFEYHPVLFCSILPLGICFGVQAIRYVKEGETEFSKWQNVIIWLVIVALFLFCVYRNIIIIKNCYH